MSEHINPEMIIWARERNRLSVEDLAALMKKEPAEIRKWEAGTEMPSYANLEALSYRHLKVPLALFFFPEPPSIEDPVGKFRRLPEYEFRRISTDTMQMMRVAGIRNLSLNSQLKELSNENCSAILIGKA